MSAKTRIWVFHMKELIYTAVFISLGIVFLILMIFMFASDQKQETTAELPSRYTAGIYTASMTLGGNPVEIAVTVDEDYISSIHFRQLDETVSACIHSWNLPSKRFLSKSWKHSLWKISPTPKRASTLP